VAPLRETLEWRLVRLRLTAKRKLSVFFASLRETLEWRLVRLRLTAKRELSVVFVSLREPRFAPPHKAKNPDVFKPEGLAHPLPGSIGPGNLYPIWTAKPEGLTHQSASTG
jgi:hypothetical protein